MTTELAVLYGVAYIAGVLSFPLGTWIGLLIVYGRRSR
jgi:hypothetical protein